MKKALVLHLGLLVVAYYLIYIGLVGIQLVPSYGLIPHNYDYTLYITGPSALALIAVGGLIFAFTYMHMEEYHEFKFKIMGKRHCEKTSYFWAVMVFIIVAILYEMAIGKWNHPIEWLELAIMSALGGYIGVLWYRAKNRKKIFSIDSLKFWSSKA